MAKNEPKCHKCVFRAESCKHGCDFAYLMFPATRKGQPPEECTYFVKGKRLESQEEARRLFGTGGTGSRPRKTKRSGAGAKEKHDWKRARKLYDLGWNDGQIGRALGCSPHTVCTWRKREALPANTGVGGRRKYDKKESL